LRLLLDTQIALWWLTGDTRLRRASRERIAGATCIVSVASVWEIAIKHRLGKLPVAPDTFVDAMRACGALILPVSESHAANYVRLPAGHADPFDLLLTATARAEKASLLTADAKLLDYAAALPPGTVEAAR